MAIETAELEWYHIFPGTAYLAVWAYGLKNASINLAGKLLTTNSVRLITIIGGYLLLRPYLQQFLSTGDFPSCDESLQKVSHDAKPPNISPNNLDAGYKDGESLDGARAEWGKRELRRERRSYRG